MAKGKWYPGKHIKEVVKAASELPSEIAKGGRKVIKEDGSEYIELVNLKFKGMFKV